MSAYTTLKITRSKAREVVLKDWLNKLYQDDVLEAYLDDILEERLYTALVVDDDYPNNDDDALGLTSD